MIQHVFPKLSLVNLISRREPGILFISLQVDSLFKLAILRLFNVIDNFIQIVQPHHDLMKAHDRQRLSGQRATMQLI